MKQNPLILGACILALLIFSSPVLATDGGVIESRYATIRYSDYDDLREFNSELYMGRLKRKISRDYDTIEGEVAAKITFIVEKVMRVLDMYPRPLKFTIEIFPDEDAVQDEFVRLYRVRVDYIAFYSPRQDKVFYSADNGTLRVVAHEIGHVIVENYFEVSPPQRIHEVLAQFAEKHVTD